MQDQGIQQRYLCGPCGKRFNERTNTPMVRLRTPTMVVAGAINMRTEGLGVRATGRSWAQIALNNYPVGTIDGAACAAPAVSGCTRGRWCDGWRRWSLYSLGCEPSPRWVYGLDDSFYWVGDSLLDRCHRRAEKASVIWARNFEC